MSSLTKILIFLLPNFYLYLTFLYFQEICLKTTSRDREEFDVKGQRIDGTVASEYKVNGTVAREYMVAS